METALRRTGRHGNRIWVIAALISVACILAFQMLGLSLVDVFTTIADALP